MDDAGVEQRGGVCPDLGLDLLDGVTVSSIVQFRDVGDYPPH